MVVCFVRRYICNVKRIKADMKQIAKVNILAAQIRKAAPGQYGRSESMKLAWSFVKQAEDAAVMTFTKLDGEITTRVVTRYWFKFQAPAGGPSKTKEGQIVFADLCKAALGIRCVISTYQQNILSLAA